MAKVPWSPDSWVKIILIVSLAFTFSMMVGAIMWRSVTRTDIDPLVIGDVLDQFIGLFGVVVGYVLGSRKDGP